MDEPPLGYRLPEEEHLFKRPTRDRSIVSDCVSPAVEGYFRIPPVWVGDAPDRRDVALLNPSVHHAVVYRKTLRCSINVSVQRDGTFLFDFSSWPLAPILVIPGFRIPDPSKPYRLPQAHTREEEKAEKYAVIRAQVMNVHQACLSTSEAMLMRRAAAMGFPVTSWNTLKALSLDVDHPYFDDTEDTYTLARNVINNVCSIQRDHPLERRTIEIEVIDHSLDMLDDILVQQDVVLLQVIESAYTSACRSREKRLGEAVTLAWGACEQLILVLWKDMLDERNAQGRTPNRIGRERRKKLTGRDYTASVMTEVLEISGRINHEIYRLLELARKSRNDWTHQMREPKESEAYICIQALTRLLQHVKGIRLELQSGGAGGVPEWPVWLWEEVRAQGGP
jgi:hypothetical protein